MKPSEKRAEEASRGTAAPTREDSAEPSEKKAEPWRGTARQERGRSPSGHLQQISMETIERAAYEQVNQTLQGHCTCDSHCVSCTLALERLKGIGILQMTSLKPPIMLVPAHPLRYFL